MICSKMAALRVRTSAAAPDHDDSYGGKWCGERGFKSNDCRRSVGRYFKACFLFLLLVSKHELLELIISMYCIVLIIYSFEGDGKIQCCGKCSSHPVVATLVAKQDKVDRLNGLLPEVKGCILEHLHHKDIFKLKSLSKHWKALIESLHITQDKVDKLDGLLPEVKGRILEHLDHEDIFKLKALSKQWKALIESVEFIQALSLRAKPVLTACSFFIDNGVWQWVAFDPKWNATSGQIGKWRKLPPLTFLPPNCDPDPDLFKQFLFCTSKGLVCMNFSKSPHEERLIVFNPLTQQWKELPPLLHRRNPVLMHMYVDQFSNSYRILAAGSSASGEESLSRITELYDSRTGKWERVGDLPGPAFALNEYQSGAFQNGNTFCIGFVELGDQTVKGILGYNMEEGIWSTKWTDRGLPNSSILQLVENNGELYLFSERDNGALIEHWVDKIEWTHLNLHEGDEEEKTETFTLVNVLKKIKSGGRSLEVYPEFALVPFGESQLCIYNTINHTGEVFDIEDPEKSEASPALPEEIRGGLGLFSLNPISFALEPQFSSKV